MLVIFSDRRRPSGSEKCHCRTTLPCPTFDKMQGILNVLSFCTFRDSQANHEKDMLVSLRGSIYSGPMCQTARAIQWDTDYHIKYKDRNQCKRPILQLISFQSHWFFCSQCFSPLSNKDIANQRAMLISERWVTWRGRYRLQRQQRHKPQQYCQIIASSLFGTPVYDLMDDV